MVYLGPSPFLLTSDANLPGSLRTVLLQPPVLEVAPTATLPPHVSSFPLSCFAELSAAVHADGCVYGHQVCACTPLFCVCVHVLCLFCFVLWVLGQLCSPCARG